MDKKQLQEEIVVDESKELYNILNFKDFVLQESKKDKKENKKNPDINDFEEFVDDMEDDFLDPNDNPKRFIKLREQFIKEELLIFKTLSNAEVVTPLIAPPKSPAEQFSK